MKKILVAILVSMLILTGCGEKTSTVDVDKLVLSEYVNVAYEGNNGLANAIIDVNINDVERVAEALGAKKEDATHYVETLVFEFEPAINLMNGDEITVKILENIEAKEALGLEVEGLEFTVIVDGLEGAVAMTNEDLYKDIQVVVDGDELTVINNSIHSKLKEVKYTVEKDGDNYVVNAEVPEDIVVDGGVKPNTDRPVVDKGGKPVGGDETPAGNNKASELVALEKGVLTVTDEESVMKIYVNVAGGVDYSPSHRITEVNLVKSEKAETTDGQYLVFAEGTITFPTGTYPAFIAGVIKNNVFNGGEVIVINPEVSPAIKTFEAFVKAAKGQSARFNITLK